MGRTKAADPTTTKLDPLESWQTLQIAIHDMDEKELETAIKAELKGKARMNMAMRMFMKKNKLRYRREREELRQLVVDANKKKK